MAEALEDLRRHVGGDWKRVVRRGHAVDQSAAVIRAPLPPAANVGPRDAACEALRREEELEPELVAEREACVGPLDVDAREASRDLCVVPTRKLIRKIRKRQTPRHIEIKLIVKSRIIIDEARAISRSNEFELKESVIADFPGEPSRARGDLRVERRLFETETDAQSPRPLEDLRSRPRGEEPARSIQERGEHVDLRRRGGDVRLNHGPASVRNARDERTAKPTLGCELAVEGGKIRTMGDAYAFRVGPREDLGSRLDEQRERGLPCDSFDVRLGLGKPCLRHPEPRRRRVFVRSLFVEHFDQRLDRRPLHAERLLQALAVQS